MMFLRWKTQELDPTGALHRAPGPHATRLARVALFEFLFLINGAPNHPLPTGTLKQTYATVASQPYLMESPLQHTSLLLHTNLT